jgi:two-component system response regulator YesN
MYKVIIVEDELLVRKGLLKTIDWAVYNMNVIADVVNGKLALDLYYEKKPDIIITDLKMPVMDGMTLIEKIRENDNETVIIILSCLDEFELIRKAMSLGVSDYIFKLTMTVEETENVLRKTQQELDKRIKAVKEPDFNIAGNEYIKEMLLKEYILYKKYTENEFKSKVKELNLNLSNENLLLCIMETDSVVMNQSEREQKHAFMLSIVDCINDILDKDGEVFCDGENRFIILISHPFVLSQKAVYEHMTLYLKKITKTIFDRYNTTVSIGVSNIQNGYASLNTMYGQAQNTLKHAFVLGTGVYFFQDSVQAEIAYKKSIEDLCQFVESHKRFFENSHEKSDMIADEFQKINWFDKISILNRFVQLFQWSATFFDMENRNTRDWVTNYTDYIRQCTTLEETIRTYKNAILEIAETSSKQSLMGDSILRATQYMQNNYHKNLSLQMVADYLGISPVYLSNLFKRKLEINFVDYLNKLRVKQAKKLLQNTSLKTYEIAEKVGFSETTYFSKTFKKYTKLSPSSYRKQLQV